MVCVYVCVCVCDGVCVCVCVLMVHWTGCWNAPWDWCSTMWIRRCEKRARRDAMWLSLVGQERELQGCVDLFDAVSIEVFSHRTYPYALEITTPYRTFTMATEKESQRDVCTSRLLRWCPYASCAFSLPACDGAVLEHLRKAAAYAKQNRTASKLPACVCRGGSKREPAC
jgi:hypothetical protein